MSQEDWPPAPQTGNVEVDAVLSELGAVGESASEDLLRRLAAGHEALHGVLSESTRPA